VEKGLNIQEVHYLLRLVRQDTQKDGISQLPSSHMISLRKTTIQKLEEQALLLTAKAVAEYKG
jgi:DNA-binding transcriptional MerR regulator